MPFQHRWWYCPQNGAPVFLMLLLLVRSSVCQQQVSQQRFDLPEEVDIGTVVGTVGAGVQGALPPYQFYSEPNSRVAQDLDINDYGLIKTKARIDREKTSKYILYALTKRMQIHVIINVLDINDNAPTFNKTSLRIVLSESTPVSSDNSLGSAVDPDNGINSTQGYEIVSGNTDGAFKLDTKKAGNVLFLNLEVNDTLDYETVPSYDLKIRAYDGGTPPKSGYLNVHVDIGDTNDNAPLFNQSRYSAKVPENATVGTTVLRVEATDQDSGQNGQVSYIIDRQHSDPHRNFEVNPTSGEIYVNKRLDYEKKSSYKLVVIARDNGSQRLQTTAVVSLAISDVNDNQPHINLVFLNDEKNGRIPEAATPGYLIAQISVSDPDVPGQNLPINVTLMGGEGHFHLQKTKNNIVFLVLNSTLDQASKPYYQLTVTATDRGKPPLRAVKSFTLYVTGTNNNEPHFPQKTYYAYIQEVAPPGSSVLQVTAVDPDVGTGALISYSIDPEESVHPEWFQIDNMTGLITTKSNMDCETMEKPHLVIMATDAGVPPLSGSTTVIVKLHDVNDNQPVFDHSFYNVSVPEDTPVGKCLLTVTATDPDCGLHSQLNYRFAANSGFPAPTGLIINATTGQICLTRSLDYEIKSSHEFAVQARDRAGLDATAMVKIVVKDVNDNSPVFYPTQYNAAVSRSKQVGSEVVAVSATDSDSGTYGTVSYRLLSNPGGYFKINQVTGVITVAQALTTSPQTIVLTIQAQDGAGSSSSPRATVTISVTTSLQKPPKFTRSLYRFRLQENSDVGTPVGTVSATAQPWDSISYSIIAGDPRGLFEVTMSDGRIRTAKLVDREEVSSVLLTVQAQRGRPATFSSAQVNVSIIDMNDNAPEFEASTITLEVQESTPLYQTIYIVQAVDKDSDLNGVVKYSIINDDGFFSVDQFTGQVKLFKALDYEKQKQHTLTIRATDQGSPEQKSAQVSLIIKVQDVNDNDPEFEKDSYSVDVPEDKEVNSKLLQVKATDKDFGNNQRITYLLRGAPDHNTFGVFANDGYIYNKIKLDREKLEHYDFTVIAIDNGVPPRSATTTVTINVLDVNDNYPSFGKPSYKFELRENLRAGSTAGVVTATDNDKLSELSYYIQGKSMLFDISPVTGVISTKRPLDRETKAYHSIVVGVKDQKVDPLTATVSVTIKVLDENDNKPVFDNGGKYTAHIPENSPAHTVVLTATVKDLDAGRNAEVHFGFDKDAGDDAEAFSIDPKSGIISTRRELDHEDRHKYTFSIIAYDGGIPTRTDKTLVEVYVDDINENGPEFPSPVLKYTVLENIKPGKIIARIPARDKDSGENAKIFFYIIRGNIMGKFGVNRDTGDLFVANPLDYDRGLHYHILQVQAVDNSMINPKSNIVTVNISVSDVNDNAPVFNNNLFLISVSENTALDTPVTTYTATDADSGEYGQILYSIVSQSPPGEWFSIHPRSGILTVASSLDYEQLTQVLLTIQATDSHPIKEKRLSSTISTRVLILDENDNSPVFQIRNRVDIMEDEPIGYPVLHLIATDEDSGPYGNVTYDVLSGNKDGHFRLNRITGLLSIAKRLDREHLPSYNLKLLAKDQGSPPRSATHQLPVYIIDVNDNPPMFEKDEYITTVEENMSVGTPVVTVKATDRDNGTNAELTYLIPYGIAENMFVINEKTGLISTNASLDREEHASWTVTVYVRDNAFPALYDTTTVRVTVLDVNDNSPTFKDRSLKLKIPENSKIEVIHTVKATDLDIKENGRLTYSLSGNDPNGKFSIDPVRGTLSCKPLDHETQASYDLVVTARDAGSPPRSSTSAINVEVTDLNDNDPKFPRSSYTTQIPEDTRKGEFVLQVQATDKDAGVNARLSYSLDNDAGGKFKINTTTGVITTDGEFDREKKDLYAFRVHATDGGLYGPRTENVRVEVGITDINDNAPVFEMIPYKANISRTHAARQFVTQVSAIDRDEGLNGEVIYSFQTVTPYFEINPTTGRIQTSRTLDAGAITIHHLEVIATDKGTPRKKATGVVEITVGNALGQGSLRFSQKMYNVSIPENSDKGKSVVQVSASFVSGGPGPVTYGFANGQEDGIFAINSQTGWITVNDKSRLDYETTPTLRLAVVASANGMPYGYTLVWVNLTDQNDNPPRFSQERYTSAVWEGNNRDTYVTQVEATDADHDANGLITYRIIAGNVGNAFVIEPAYSGIIKTRLMLDHEIRASYRLVIEASDQGKPRLKSTCTLKIQVIDVNDNAPTFPPYRPIRVKEGISVGTMIFHVTANDADLNPTLSYDLLPSGDGRDTFSIDRFSGKISLIKELDYELQEAYLLTVQASDGKNLKSTNISVVVLDENDNAPKFSQQSYQATVLEMTPPGHPVIEVKATDKDDGENAQLTYSMYVIDGFSINPSTGTIYTNKTVTFNPGQPPIHLVVTAKDHGTPALSEVVAVRVHIVDVNNHSPVFSKASYSTSVKEDEKVGHKILQVDAIDDDDSYENKKVDYSILSGNENGVFRITPNSGELLLAAMLNRETRSSYRLDIQAADRGKPKLSSITTVTVEVLDVNDNEPVFNQSHYSVLVPEDKPIKSHLLHVKATDLDEGENGRITYAITSGNGHGLFSLNKDTGLIQLEKPLDYETDKSHELVIMAQDMGVKVKYSAYVTVAINVSDVNEYAPRFLVMMYFESVLEKQNPGKHVFTARAHDKDAGYYGKIEYKLMNHNQFFAINSKTGVVTTVVEFNYQANSSYIFNVTATDQGGKMDIAPAEIKIEPIDQYIPQFAQKSFTFDLPGNAKKGDVVGQIKVNAKDGLNVIFTFADPNEYFDINRTTGVITVTKSLLADGENRQRRSIRSNTNGHSKRMKRALKDDSVSLLVVARSALRPSQQSSTMVHIDIDRSCDGCALLPLAQPASGLSTALVLVIVFAIVAVILIVVVGTMYFRSRQRKNKQPSVPPYSYESSLDSLHVQPPPPPFGHDIPPPYNEVHGYRPQNHNPTTSELSDQSQSASSGRGSVEEDDEEIRMINSNSIQSKSLLRGGMPDSGIQQDADAISEHSVQNHQEYFARLGIDTSKLKATSSGATAISSSVESMHQFSDEGGGEGDGMDIEQLPYPQYGAGEADASMAAVTEHQDYNLQEAQPKHNGSLSSVINYEEELSGSYNWDYLLDWGPQYQPLADVFDEIARLKDDSLVPKKQPTKIIPQRTNNTALNTQPKSYPPPIITDIPPMTLEQPGLDGAGPSQSSSSYSGNNGVHSVATSQLTSLPSLPRSPISHESSYTTPAFSPSFSPSLSPLGTCSPSISPLVTPKGGSTGHATPNTMPSNRPAPYILEGFSNSEQELHI